ncbi:MAG TPA: DnaA/Hda family protein [Alphaproteobacteria bacterium]|nr:DnaA/Hda family protein [Alphaproteobacteria bacterium]
MNRPRQLPLALPQRAALGMEDFLVADCNRAAVGWIDGWPEWPGPLLVLSGPEGCGKTHLAHVWQARTGAAVASATELPRIDPGAFEGPFALVIEDLEAGLSPQAERNLFHLYNVAAEGKGHLLVTSRLPPAARRVSIPDLASRLGAAPAAIIGPPDDPLLAAVIVKLMADRQLKVAAEVVSYLVPRIERSFASVRRIVAAIDDAALAENRNITVAFVRQVLEDEGD